MRRGREQPGGREQANNEDLLLMIILMANGDLDVVVDFEDASVAEELW